MEPKPFDGKAIVRRGELRFLLCSANCTWLHLSQEVFAQYRMQFSRPEAEGQAGAPEPAGASAGDGSTGHLLQDALLHLVGKPTRELVAVDMGAKIAELGLAELIPEEVYRAARMGEHASLIAFLCRRGRQRTRSVRSPQSCASEPSKGKRMCLL